MDPIITPAIFLLGLLAIHSKTSGNPGGIGSKAAPQVGGPAVGGTSEAEEPEGEIIFSPEWRTAALDVRASKNGARVQYFKPRVCVAIEKGLSNVSLERVTIEGDTTALVYRVVPGAGDLSVAKAIQIGRAKNLAVLATLPLTLPDTTAERYVMICKPGDLVMATEGTNLAVLSDPTPPLAAKAQAAVGAVVTDVRTGEVKAPGDALPAGSVMSAAMPPPEAVKPGKKKRVSQRATKKITAPDVSPRSGDGSRPPNPLGSGPLNGMNHTASKAEESEPRHELPVD